MEWMSKLSDWLERWPWAFRVWVLVILTLSPLLFAIILVREEWTDIKGFYKEAWGALKEGKRS